MREILFRGKNTYNKEWEYGYLVHGEEDNKKHHYPGYYILKDNFIVDATIGTTIAHCITQVEESTICQYTNKDDIRGNKIFVGDIIKVPFWRKKGTGLFMKGIVEFHNSAFSVLWEDADYGRNFLGYIDDIEVIGNVYDNPELIPSYQ